MEVSEHATVIAGRYRLDSLIGEGGMAAVWRAEDLTLRRSVAVKLLYARDDRDRRRLVDQFVREARIAAAVQHRNVINIVDFGTTVEHTPYMVMELLQGESLGQRLKRDPPLTIAQVVQIAGMTLRGLSAVHEAGIVHRDLKPDNIFLKEDGSSLFPKILDFGISRSVEPRSGRRSALTTREGIIVGTPEYMSPEQARGLKAIDRRADIYSMGVILYQALAEKLPFSSENVGDLIIQIVTGSAPRAHEVNPDIPEAISSVIAKAMARRVEDRFETAQQMQHALQAAAEQGLAVEVVRSLSDGPPSGGETFREAALSHERLRTLELPLADEPDADPAPPLEPPRTAPPRLQVPPPAGAIDLPRSEQVREVSSRSRLVVLALTGLLLTGTLAWWWWPSPQGDQPEMLADVPKASAGSSAPSPSPAAAAAKPTTITVKLNGLPDNARVTVDGMPADAAPLRLPRDGDNRVIRVEAAGKAPWQVVHHASTDASYQVFLAEAPRAPSPRVHKPARHKPSAAKRRRPAAAKKPPPVLRKLDF